MEIERVAPDVERLPLRTPTLPPATHTNCYFVGGRRFVIVEPASPFGPERRALLDAVRERLALGDRPVAALVTHHHPDHVGGAMAAREAFSIPVLAHPVTREKLSGSVTVDRDVDEGDPELASLGVEALHTPGHAPGHLCLRSRRHGWLIAGDMVASEGTIVIDPDDGGDMDAYLAQLERLSSLAPAVLLPAHGAPIEDAVGRLGFYVHHRLQREAKVLAAVKPEGSTLGEVLRLAYADTPLALWPLAAKSARAHLARLVARGTVTPGREPLSWRASG